MPTGNLTLLRTGRYSAIDERTKYTNLLMRDSTRYLRIFWTAVSFIFVVMPSSQTMTYVAGFDASMESTTPS